MLLRTGLSQHPEMSNSTRQHPPKLQPSVHNCLCIKVKTEKSSKAWLSGSVQCACSLHQFTIQLALLPQLNARVYTVDSLCESEVISDRLRSRSPPLSLARSLSPSYKNIILNRRGRSFIRRACVDSTTKPYSYLPKHYQVPVLPCPRIVSDQAWFCHKNANKYEQSQVVFWGLHWNRAAFWLKCDQLLIAAVI